MWPCMRLRPRGSGLSSAGGPPNLWALPNSRRYRVQWGEGMGNPQPEGVFLPLPPGVLWSQGRAWAPGRPTRAPFGITPVPGLTSRLAVRTCACSRREEISTKECAVREPADRMGLPERERARRAPGDRSREGKQRCAGAAGQAAPAQPLFPAPRVRCTGLTAES